MIDRAKASETTFVAMVARRRLIDRLRKVFREPALEELSAINDPAETRAAEDLETKDDGGAFDIDSAQGEIIVPIDAKLTVEDPRAFAITLEQPGGVVVSDGPLLVLAPVDA